MGTNERLYCSVCERILTRKEIEGCRRYNIRPPICTACLANKVARAREQKRQAEKQAAREFAEKMRKKSLPKNSPYEHDLSLATVSRLLGLKPDAVRFREIFALGLLPHKKDPISGRVTVRPADLATFIKRVQADDPQIPELIRILVQLGINKGRIN